MVKALYSSRANSKKFTDWASDSLFTIQMGTKKQKNELASSLLGLDVATLTRMLNVFTNKISCLYMFSIGTVKSLRKKYNISDEYIVIKYGRTEDFKRRLREHKKKYGIHIELLILEMIDNTYASEAETALGNYFEEVYNKLETDVDGKKEIELVTINASNIKSIKNQYSLLGTKYVCKVSEFFAILKEVTHKNDLIMIRVSKLKIRDSKCKKTKKNLER